MTQLIGARIDAIIERHNLLRHPFYRRWSLGELSEEELRVYAREYFHFVRAIPTLVSSIHANCRDHAVRLSILENLIEEETGSDGLVSHEELWSWFAHALGVDRTELYSQCESTATRKLLLTYRNLCWASNCAVGAAAMYTYESRIPEISESKLNGLQRFYQIHCENALRFFREHMMVDTEHARTWLEIIKSSTQTSDQEEQVLEATLKAARALWGMLDGVCDQCGIPLVQR